jgi:HSP20 family protein
MFYTTHKRRNHGLNNFLPLFENILNEVTNAPLDDIVNSKETKFNRPKANVIEFNEHYLITMAVPGMIKEDITITLEDENLIISSEKEDINENSNFKLREFAFGKFNRKFILPKNVDKSNIEASFDAGILSIKVNKEEEAKPKSINIK